MTDFELQRADMVRQQIAFRGVSDPRVLQALREVPRERFVETSLQERAFDDTPLPIGEEQTISQPYIVGLMLEAMQLRPDFRVLEVGTGSGYAAAVLSRLVRTVVTVERHEILANQAREVLRALGYANVEVHGADGTCGWIPSAPYDAIVVAAGGEQVPQPLKDQLKVGGRLVIPVGRPEEQYLTVYLRVSTQAFQRYRLAQVRFVPLLTGRVR